MWTLPQLKIVDLQANALVLLDVKAAARPLPLVSSGFAEAEMRVLAAFRFAPSHRDAASQRSRSPPSPAVSGRRRAQTGGLANFFSACFSGQ